MVWGFLVYLGHVIKKGLRIGFGIWAEIPLFWAVDTVRDLA